MVWGSTWHIRIYYVHMYCMFSLSEGLIDSLFTFHLAVLYTGSVGRRLLHITVVGSSVWYIGSVVVLDLPPVAVK